MEAAWSTELHGQDLVKLIDNYGISQEVPTLNEAYTRQLACVFPF